MRRVIFVNRYFYPDHSATSQMLSDLAFGLAQCGHRVTVITSRLRYDAPEAVLPARETVHGVEAVRLWTTRFGRHHLLGRAIDYLSFYLSAAISIWLHARDGTVVVAKTDPPMLGVLAWPITAWRGAKSVNWLQDIYPEVAQALGVGRGRIAGLVYRLLEAVRNRSLRRAAANVVLGERMAELLGRLGVEPGRIRIIPNWADCELVRPQERGANPLRQAWGLEGKFVVGYSGNLGRAHDYATLLEAIAKIERRSAEGAPPGIPPIVWLFIGGGAQFEAFKADVRARGLTSVSFQPYQPREQLSSSLSAADVHLVTLRPELEGLIVPSKFYGIAAAGRPTLFIGDEDGEIARMLRQHQCGLTIAQGDGQGLAQAIVELSRDAERGRRMGQRARAACVDRFDRQVTLAAWEAMLAEL